MIIRYPALKRGEIWLANFDPTVGAEIKKVRPAIVVSSDGVGKLPIKLIAPITDWKEYYADNIWLYSLIISHDERKVKFNLYNSRKGKIVKRSHF
ncbi:MAG: type II toxin-antitoxin system PemK/MazF family toxin [Nostoc sp.]|uniref:type II toxin-antitoxin system PemK/MazF family toxin n=1 Tax=Nostoc sp. TaxID=1180 RepID=UPI002FF98CB6